MGTIHQHQNSYNINLGKVIVYSIIGLLIAGFGSKIVEFGEKLRHKTADDKAKNILENPEKVGDYAVYLRSFNIDQTFENNNSLARPGKDYFEKVLYVSLNETYPLIALGESNEDIQGIGRAGLYENWKERVSPLYLDHN